MNPDDFAASRVFPTRWADNDVYGHMNNTVHYQMFDTMINGWLARNAPEAKDAVNVVAESGCRYFAEVGFPDDVLLGVSVERLGTSSVTYTLGLFSQPADGAPPVLAAQGHWVHVYIDPETRRPAAVPEGIRTALKTLLREPAVPDAEKRATAWGSDTAS
ncbi:acyl-CoA thioesterase [Streptomyces sp. NPDC057539]|uniref:acyl-CoA thioesterase n=1 Tax=Streptomyces sp. NPDC057539 TaxID=3346159 RepID=UPI0036D0C76F